jgi:hypothetical protein
MRHVREGTVNADNIDKDLKEVTQFEITMRIKSRGRLLHPY